MDRFTIKERMKAKGLRSVDVARHLGIDDIKVANILAGRRRVQASELDKLRELLGDAGPGGIPIIGLVAAGNWREAVRQSVASLPRLDPSIPREAFALQVEGDSMNMVAPEGTTVVVDPGDRALFPGRYFVVRNGDGETTFKQFKADPARLVPCSTNPAHKEIPIGTGEPFEVVGRVIWQASRM